LNVYASPRELLAEIAQSLAGSPREQASPPENSISIVPAQVRPASLGHQLKSETASQLKKALAGDSRR